MNTGSAGTLLVGPLLALCLAVNAHAAGDVATGRDVARQCAGCHGLDGLAKRPDVPNIGGESEIYLKSQLEAFRSGARHHEQMTIIAQGLSDEEVAHVIAWYAAIEVTVRMPE